jgi:gamma-glutamyltranspeptidase / glutathione hydrolase
VDAAVATSFAIGVVEPQMSGLGGSGAMLIWRQEAGQPEYLDFYAMQNAASFRGHTGDNSGATDMRIVGIPARWRACSRPTSGTGACPSLPVMAPAIRLAEEGFPSARSWRSSSLADSAKLHRFDDSRDRMWPGGTALAPGACCATRTRRHAPCIARDGRAGFYEGDVARAVVAAMNAGGHPVSMDDLAAFRPQWKRPLCAEYRGRVVLSAPPPQTGGQVIQALKLLEPVSLAALGLPTRSPQAFDALVSALRIAMADNRGNDDPRWAHVPASGRTSDAFAVERRVLVGTGTAPSAIDPGGPAHA